MVKYQPYMHTHIECHIDTYAHITHIETHLYISQSHGIFPLIGVLLSERLPFYNAVAGEPYSLYVQYRITDYLDTFLFYLTNLNQSCIYDFTDVSWNRMFS